MSTSIAKPKIFYSYAHEDEDLRNELQKHLQSLLDAGLIDSWTDRDIKPGEEWDTAISDALEDADIILLLISPDFLASRYIKSKELSRALERRADRSAEVVPIILRTCNWKVNPQLASLQALPKDAMPVKKFPSIDEGFTDVAIGLQQLIEKLGPPQKKKAVDPAEALAAEDSIRKALDSFDWAAADQIVEALIQRLQRGDAVLNDIAAGRTMERLRRKERFPTMARLGDAFVQYTTASPTMQRQYADALVEEGRAGAARLILQGLSQLQDLGRAEKAEIHAGIGRAWQRSLTHDAPRGTDADELLSRAVQAYIAAHQIESDNRIRHGASVVALLTRAQRDNLTVRPVQKAPEWADKVRQEIREKEVSTLNGLQPADLSAAIEVELALSNTQAALERARRFSDHPDADAFDLANAIRQLKEVWQLAETDPFGSAVLPLLRAAHLRRSGGGMVVPIARADRELSKIFVDDRTQTLKWYQQALSRTKGVARIERIDGRGIATAFLIDISSVRGSAVPPVLITANHTVASEPSNYGALRPEEAIANFQGSGLRLDLKRMIASSSPDLLDYSLFELADAVLSLDPLPVSSRPLSASLSQQRVYIMGYPGGRDLEFSLHDNLLIAATDTKLHYRTPTEPGSAGSPVFEEDRWEVVALHHAGGILPRLDGGSGTYEANEGIAMTAILDDIAKKLNS